MSPSGSPSTSACGEGMGFFFPEGGDEAFMRAQGRRQRFCAHVCSCCYLYCARCASTITGEGGHNRARGVTLDDAQLRMESSLTQANAVALAATSTSPYGCCRRSLRLGRGPFTIGINTWVLGLQGVCEPRDERESDARTFGDLEAAAGAPDGERRLEPVRPRNPIQVPLISHWRDECGSGASYARQGRTGT